MIKELHPEKAEELTWSVSGRLGKRTSGMQRDFQVFYCSYEL